MAVNVKISEEMHDAAYTSAKAFNRTLGRQVDYWAKIGRLAEQHPGLTFELLQKLMLENHQNILLAREDRQAFSAISLKTKGFRFDREDANAR